MAQTPYIVVSIVFAVLQMILAWVVMAISAVSLTGLVGLKSVANQSDLGLSSSEVATAQDWANRGIAFTAFVLFISIAAIIGGFVSILLNSITACKRSERGLGFWRGMLIFDVVYALAWMAAAVVVSVYAGMCGTECAKSGGIGAVMVPWIIFLLYVPAIVCDSLRVRQVRRARHGKQADFGMAPLSSPYQQYAQQYPVAAQV